MLNLCKFNFKGRSYVAAFFIPGWIRFGAVYIRCHMLNTAVLAKSHIDIEWYIFMALNSLLGAI